MPLSPMPEESNDKLDQATVDHLKFEADEALATAYRTLNKLYHGTVGYAPFDAFAHAYNLVGIARHMVRNAPALAPAETPDAPPYKVYIEDDTPPETR